MAKKITLKHKLADGGIATRTTARTYECVLVGQYNWKAKRERLEAVIANPVPSKTDVSNFAWYQRKIAAGPDAAPVNSWETPESVRRDYDDAVHRIGNATTPAEYRARAAALELADILEKVGEIDLGPFLDLAWCGRMDLAAKQANKWAGYGYTNIRPEVINGGEIK